MSPNLVFELPRVSSRSSDADSSWILSPSHGFTGPALLLPNVNSSDIAWQIGISPVRSEPTAMAGEQVPLWPGVQTRDPPPAAKLASPPNPNGLDETRLMVGEVEPVWGTRSPANHSGSGRTWRPGLGGVEEERRDWFFPFQGKQKDWSCQLRLARGLWQLGELRGGVTGALIEPPGT